MAKIVNVIGTRPNFVKIAPIMREFKKFSDIQAILVHTGQHYDYQMSKLFFQDLKIPRPDIDLEVGPSSHAVQTAEVMKRLEPLLLQQEPDLVVVVGDVNSTLAGALTAAKLGIPVAHVEAGLRSFDPTMPEEINRKLTDAVSDFLFITEPSAEENLIREGIAKEKIFFVGNTMIDTLLQNRGRAKKSKILKRLGLLEGNGLRARSYRAAHSASRSQHGVCPYAVLTMHRPSNVDNREKLSHILGAIAEIAERVPILFPMHPRTRQQIVRFGLEDYLKCEGAVQGGGIYWLNPLGYLDFLQLMLHAKLILTDSGGIQEESTMLGIHCVTLRENTERPVTVTEGTNVIVGTDRDCIIAEGLKALSSTPKKRKAPKLWDGKAAQRVVRILRKSVKSL